MISRPLSWLAFGVALCCAGCTAPPVAPAAAGSGVVDHGAQRMVVSAHPLASEAGLDMLRAGGTAIDAAIAAQAVLGLLEPQASGLLGGSEMLAWDPVTRETTSFDGMATAPAAATRAVTLDASGELLDPRQVAFSPRAVGVPGVLPALWAAHQAQGRLPWARLFERAIALADGGAPMPRQLHDLLEEPGADTALAALRAPYLGADGRVLAVGQSFRNPAYAAVLRRVAQMGPEGLYKNGGMEAVLGVLGQGAYASAITAADLRQASPRVGPALCQPWKGLRICTAPTPSVGGFVMLQILGMLEDGDWTDAGFVHRFLEASRLAQADRRRYLADPGFVDMPVTELLAPAYLADRAALIQPGSTIAQPRAGEMQEADSSLPDPHPVQSATSSIAVVDGDGRAVAMTGTINLHFGARIAAEGMMFNNALLNFAPPPPTSLPELGGHYANEMAPGKRPVSPIAPVIVFDADGKLLLIGGGAGGPPIPDTMAMALIDVLARHVPLAQALAAGHFHAADPDHIALEAGTEAASLQPALEADGHRVELEPVNTGNVLLLHGADGWSGAADPRRDGGRAQGLK